MDKEESKIINLEVSQESWFTVMNDLIRIYESKDDLMSLAKILDDDISIPQRDIKIHDCEAYKAYIVDMFLYEEIDKHPGFKEVLDEVLEKNDIEFDGYFGFVNSLSPLWLSYKGIDRINPKNFELVCKQMKFTFSCPKLKPEDTSDGCEKVHNNALKSIWNFRHRSSKDYTMAGWTKATLRKAIVETAKSIATGKKCDLVSVLNLNIFFKNDVLDGDKVFPPGLGLAYYTADNKLFDEPNPCERASYPGLVVWRTHNFRREYYIALYAALIGLNLEK